MNIKDLDISKDDFLDAIERGVKGGILEMTELGDGYSGPIIREVFLDHVRKGVADALWRLATNATDMPCSDFYEMVKQGVKEGFLLKEQD